MGLVLSALCCGKPKTEPSQDSRDFSKGNPAQRPVSKIPPPTPISRKALLIGIRYSTARPSRSRQQEVSDLGVAPHNEVDIWRNILIKNFGYREEDVICMMDTEEYRETTRWPNRANILDQLAALVHNTKPADRRFLLVAGHGSQRACTSDWTELDGKDEVMTTMEQNGTCAIIKDNDFRRILVDGLPRGAFLRVILELCNSGTLLDLPFQLRIAEDGRSTISDAKREASDVQPDILCLSACEDAQNAYTCSDDQGRELGLITATISETLKNARGDIKLRVVGLLHSFLEPVPPTDTNSRQQTPMVTLGRRMNEEELSNLIFEP